MARVHADLVKETSTTTGTGTYTLAGAASGYRAFSVIGDGNKCYYRAKMGSDWEIGLGTYTASGTTLARTRVVLSTNGNAAVNWGAGTKEIAIVPVAFFAGDIAPPKGHIYGLIMSNAADATNDITVAAGEATDDTGDVLIRLTSAITKQIDATWAVGNNAGGMNTGSVANSTWYEVHLIFREDTGVVDVMFTTTGNRATLPAGYTHKRRIGWVRRNGAAANLAFTQKGDYFTLTTQVNDVAASVTTTATPVALTAPPDTIARFRAGATTNASINASECIVFSEIAEGNVTPDDTTGICSLGLSDIIGCVAAHFELRVSSSSQIEHDGSATTGSPTFDISTYGWIDCRGREEAA